MSIVILHFLSFKIVEFIIINLYDLPNFCLATFPQLYGNIGIWWIAYTVVGIAIPIILSISYEYVMKKINKIYARYYHEKHI